MIVELGHFALILAACVAIIQGVLPLAGTVNDHQRWQALARPMAIVQFLLIAFAFGVMPNIPILCCLLNTNLHLSGADTKALCCSGY